MIGAQNKHRYAGAHLKKTETVRCAMAAIAGRVPRYKTPVKLHFRWIEPNRKRDLDNIRYGAKWILDGLRESGKLTNDGWACVVGMSDEWLIDKVNPRIEIVITEVVDGKS
jgi:Holliday junction resolvase RusA-like endonuclease